MEFNITDLLDDVQDISPDIHAKNIIRKERVKELTMMKIHRHRNSASVRSGRFAVRVALIAAVLVCLSVTVLAAVGDYIPQWISDNPEETIGYENDLYIGSASKNWDIEGWLMELKAENVTSIGLTMVCTEWSGQAQMGSLSTDDAYWLERWNGSGYEIYSPEKAPNASCNTMMIQANTTHSWVINWEESYGILAPGNYRLGKNFQHVADSGYSQNTVCYVKFRVLEEDMATYYTQYETAMKMLATQENLHLTWQVFPENPAGYVSYATEIWKAGENHLQNLCYLDENGIVLSHKGAALYDGKGYRLNWIDGDIDADVVQCELDSSVEKDTFYLWQTFLNFPAAGVDEAVKEGNTVVYIERADSPTESNWETVLTLTDAGQILNIKQYSICGETKTLYSEFTVHDTAPEQITQTVEGQKLVEFEMSDTLSG